MFQGIDINFVETLLHSGYIHLVRGVGKVTRHSGVSSLGIGIRQCPDIAERVDKIGTDDELTAFLMNHAVSRRASDAFGTHLHGKRIVNLIQLIA